MCLARFDERLSYRKFQAYDKTNFPMPQFLDSTFLHDVTIALRKEILKFLSLKLNRSIVMISTIIISTLNYNNVVVG